MVLLAYRYHSIASQSAWQGHDPATNRSAVISFAQSGSRPEWSVAYESIVRCSIAASPQHGPVSKRRCSNTAVARAASHQDFVSQLCGAQSSTRISSCRTYQHWNGLFSLRVLRRMMIKEKTRPSRGAIARENRPLRRRGIPCALFMIPKSFLRCRMRARDDVRLLAATRVASTSDLLSQLCRGAIHEDQFLQHIR